MQLKDETWDLIIQPRNRFFNLGLKDLIRYKDLLFLFVKRDIVSVYKQTILGPIWFFLQPVISALIYTFIFGFVAKMNTDDVPPILFYLGGLTLWNYFAECLVKTSETFIQNQNIFGKVYFPRLIVPLSFILSAMLKLLIQFAVFMVFWMYYYFGKPETIHPHTTILLLPVLILIIAGLSLGFGIIFSSLTTKYRDIRFLLQFGVQLLMYASSVIIPLSQVPENYKWIMKLNPVVSVIETFKHGFLGTGIFDWTNLAYSFIFMIILILVGLVMFNRVEKTFMDTV